MSSTKYKLVEFLIIFIIHPIVFTQKFPIRIKLLMGIIGFFYIIFILLKIENNKFKIASNINWKAFWNRTFIKFIIIAIITTAFVWFTAKDLLFNVVINKPKLWIVILFVYSFLSVYPQELIYRTFFFKRYGEFFNSTNLLLFVNAIVFSIGHIFFRNTMVLLLTFLGGLLFAFTYNKTKSTLLVSIEHAIYGCWLFTVGMGDMLAFPS